jgi:hypothetical protein
MERAAASASPTPSLFFSDGLGERRQSTDPAGTDAIELLCLRGDLSAVPSFEFALRERVSRLATFRHAYYGRVRSVERATDVEQSLTLTSDATPGIRLSEILTKTEQRRIPFDINAALCLIRQLVPAVAMLHESARDVAIGALGPERLIITPHARLVIVEYVLGAALEQLRFSQERYWSELRVALPRSAGQPRFDHRADVTQIGIVALSLVLGRNLREDEYPARVGDVVAATWAISAKGGFEPLPPGLRGWLGRALQLDARGSFATAIEARTELDQVLGDGDLMGSPASLEAFLTRYNAAEGPGTRMTPVAATAAKVPAPAPVRAAPAVAAPNAIVRPPSPAPAPVAPVTLPPKPVTAAAPAPRTGVVTPKPAVVPPVPSAKPPSAVAQPKPVARVPAPETRPSAVAPSPVASPAVAAPRAQAPAAAVRAAAPVARPEPQPYIRAVEVELLGGSNQMPPASASTPEAAPSRPPMVTSLSHFDTQVDDAQSESALEVDFDRQPGSRRWMWIASGLGVVIALVTGGMFAARLVFPGTAATTVTTGTLVITTNPAGAQAIVDGERRGLTPLTLTLAAGAHTVELRGAGEPRTVPVTITAGVQAAQYIDLPKAAAAAGQLQIKTDPPGARVSVDGLPRGNSPVLVADLAPGEHTIVAESELGVAKQSVIVQSGATATLVLTPGASPASSSGWLSVSTPFEVQLFEQGRLLGSSQTDRIMVTSGRHDLEIVNDALGYRSTQTVQVPAGKTATITVTVPTGVIALNAVPWAEVWIDGEKIGETPIGNLSIAIGAHDVVFRHPELGEQHHTAMVTLKNPTRLSVDLRKK